MLLGKNEKVIEGLTGNGNSEKIGLIGNLYKYLTQTENFFDPNTFFIYKKRPAGFKYYNKL
jgi:hypothetical protein